MATSASAAAPKNRDAEMASTPLESDEDKLCLVLKEHGFVRVEELPHNAVSKKAFIAGIFLLLLSPLSFLPLLFWKVLLADAQHHLKKSDLARSRPALWMEYFHTFWSFPLNTPFRMRGLLQLFLYDAIASVFTALGVYWKLNDKEFAASWTEVIGIISCARFALLGLVGNSSCRYKASFLSLASSRDRSETRKTSAAWRFLQDKAASFASPEIQSLEEILKTAQLESGVRLNGPILKTLRVLMDQRGSKTPTAYDLYLRMESQPSSSFAYLLLGRIIPVILCLFPPFVPLIVRSKIHQTSDDAKTVLITVVFILFAIVFSFTATMWFVSTGIRALRKAAQLCFLQILCKNDGNNAARYGVANWRFLAVGNFKAVSALLKYVIDKSALVSGSDSITISGFSLVAVSMGVALIIGLLADRLPVDVMPFTMIVSLFYYGILVIFTILTGAYCNSLKTVLQMNVADNMIVLDHNPANDAAVLRPMLQGLSHRLGLSADRESWLGLRSGSSLVYLWLIVLVVVATLTFIRLV